MGFKIRCYLTKYSCFVIFLLNVVMMEQVACERLYFYSFVQRIRESVSLIVKQVNGLPEL